MWISELGTIITSLAKLHGEEYKEVTISAIQYEEGKTLHVSTSSKSLGVISSIIFDSKNKEEK
ncbi:hypothetical protein [Enterococcus casseliflavus]|uniref:hypothetical protein n=1 Tax=Enterococcus casseliflavus TaxID=37734 RepID=UPI001BD046DB|nr:hypothetical protein [Enterococcus casseliflavus]